jgi:hypothetical protein
MSGRAALNIEGTNETYFFKGDKYVKIKWTPGTSDGESISYGPTEFVKEWDSLKQTGFKQIDAILPLPDNTAYFFSGKQYARIKYFPGAPGDHIIGSVRTITDAWPSLKKAGFETVDAALNTPGRPGQAYIFSSEKYVRVQYQQGVSDDTIVDGPKAISAGWHSLPFKSLDTVIPRPGNDQNGYFFSGSKYVQLKLNVGNADDEIISGEREVAEYWPSLKKAGFY